MLRLALVLFLVPALAAAQPVLDKPDASGPQGERVESLVARPGPADDEPEAAVRALIDALFDGMRASDSAAVRATFHPQARLATALGDTTGVLAGDLELFLSSIASAPPGALDEQLGTYEVDVHGPLAVAVTPYHFYLQGRLSHCGVNAFTLVEERGRWWIWSVTDTRVRTGCPGGLEAD